MYGKQALSVSVRRDAASAGEPTRFERGCGSDDRTGDRAEADRGDGHDDEASRYRDGHDHAPLPSLATGAGVGLMVYVMNLGERWERAPIPGG